MPVFSKFLSLPLLAQENIFRLMHITDLFFFSQTSKRAEKLVNAARPKVHCLLSLRDEEMVITLLSTERPDKERFSWRFSMSISLLELFEQGKAIINGKEFEFWFNHDRNKEIFTYCQDFCGAINMIFHHYQYLFNIKNYLQVKMEDKFETDIPAVLKELNLTVTTDVAIDTNEPVTEKEWNQLVDNLKFMRLLVSASITYPIDFSKISFTKYLVLQDSGAFTGEHLLQITPIEYVQLMKVIPFDPIYLKRYVQNWLERTDNGFMALEIELKDDYKWEGPEESFSDLKTFEYDPKRRPERFKFKRQCKHCKCVRCTGESTEDCKNGRDVVRSDGRIATIILKPDYFLMVAWEQRYRQAFC